MLEQKITAVIDNHPNGFILLNNEAEVIFANKTMNGLTQNEYGLFGNFMNCKNTTHNRACYENPTVCQKCQIRRNLLRLMSDKQDRWLVNIPFETKESVIYFDCLMTPIDEGICLEFLNVKKQDSSVFVLDKVFDYTNDFMYYKDDSLKYCYLNQTFADLVEQDKQEILFKTDEQLNQNLFVRTCLNEDALTLEPETKSIYKEVGEIVYQINKTKIHEGMLVVGRDVTESYHTGKLAYLDELTGLENRRQFTSDIQTIYQNQSQNCYLVMIDLDGLRDLNNTFGHHKGDLYLKQLADVLKTVENGTFYRLAGDEFTGILSGCHSSVEKTMQVIYQQLDALALVPKLTISAGVKQIDVNLPYEENYDQTDELLYQAKRSGKNRYCFKSE